MKIIFKDQVGEILEYSAEQKSTRFCLRVIDTDSLILGLWIQILLDFEVTEVKQWLFRMESKIQEESQ